MTDAVSAQGVTVQRGDGASPEAFTTIGEITDFTTPDGELTMIDATSLDSTAMEFIAGLIDNGQVQISGNYLGGDTAQSGLRTDRTAKTLRNFKITLTDSPASVFSFAAYVLSFTISGAVNDRLQFAATLKVSGAVTES